MAKRNKKAGLTKDDAKTECQICGQRAKVKCMRKIDGKYYHPYCVDEE